MQSLLGYLMRGKLLKLWAYLVLCALFLVQGCGSKTIPSASAAGADVKKDGVKEPGTAKVDDGFEPASEASNVSGSYLTGSCDEMSAGQKQIHGVPDEAFVVYCALKPKQSGNSLDNVSLGKVLVEMSDSQTYSFDAQTLQDSDHEPADGFRFMFEIPNRPADLFVRAITLEKVSVKNGVKEIIEVSVKVGLRDKLLADLRNGSGDAKSMETGRNNGNGKSNGLKNGIGNGKSNGLKSGIGNGKSNGLKNGIGNGNAKGLKSGIGNGNAKGMKNGNGNKKSGENKQGPGGAAEIRRAE